MYPALWISKTGLDAQQLNISVISNNLANVSTTGYKRSRAVFEDLLYQTIRQPGAQSSQNTTIPSGLMLGTGVRPVATQKIFQGGDLIQSDNALDIAIQGRGFFSVLKPDSTTGYTRSGDFQLDADGQIVTANGYILQPAITVPTDAQSITIGSDGTVSVMQAGQTAATQIGTIQLTDFPNPTGLMPIGENLFSETTSSGAAQTGNPGSNGLGGLLQKSLEASNVNVVEELVNMIETQRAYEMNSKAIQTVDQMLQYVGQSL